MDIIKRNEAGKSSLAFPHLHLRTPPDLP